MGNGRFVYILSAEQYGGNTYMGRYYQGVETHFSGNIAWCIARLVAPEQNKYIFCKF